MPSEKQITLVLTPGQAIKATIIALTPELADHKVMGEWWTEDCLDIAVADKQIDRFWNWNDVGVEYDGKPLQFTKVAVVTGKDTNLSVQGAMVISTEPIKSALDPASSGCLQVEYLFTAPRNRPAVRKDRQQYVVGVGTQLLIWGAILSQDNGCEGRLRLDASPDFVGWYGKKRFAKTGFKSYRVRRYGIHSDGITCCPSPGIAVCVAMTELTMNLRFLKFITGRACRKQEAALPLPKGFEAAPPIKNEKLRELLQGPDITTSGGIHLVSEGRPLLSRQEVHH